MSFLPQIFSLGAKLFDYDNWLWVAKLLFCVMYKESLNLGGTQEVENVSSKTKCSQDPFREKYW